MKLNLRKPNGEMSRRELLKLALPSYEAVPFGKLSLNREQCSGCWLCATDCPSGALTATSGTEDDYQLLFRPELCDACGKCVEACPERCLQLEHVPELDKTDNSTTVLFEDRIARCRECGNKIGSQAMINKLRSKLPGGALSTYFELCPNCKMKGQLKLSNNNGHIS